MKIPILQQLDDEFDDRNLFLQLMLGAVSLSARLDRLIDRYGAPATDRDMCPEDEQMVLCVLGVIACRQRLMHALEGAADRPTARRWAETARDNGPDRALRPRDLSR